MKIFRDPKSNLPPIYFPPRFFPTQTINIWRFLKSFGTLRGMIWELFFMSTNIDSIDWILKFGIQIKFSLSKFRKQPRDGVKNLCDRKNSWNQSLKITYLSTWQKNGNGCAMVQKKRIFVKEKTREIRAWKLPVYLSSK